MNPGSAPLILFCDHAGRAFPKKLGQPRPDAGTARSAHRLGYRHRQCAAILSRNLDAPCAFASYSRLVIDCNRRLDDPTSIAQESDRITIPGNRGLDAKARAQRAEEIFRPYHIAVDKVIQGQDRRRPIAGDPVAAQLHAGR